jgi:hypothetical protein
MTYDITDTVITNSVVNEHSVIKSLSGIICRELLENLVAVKPKRLSHKEEEELTLLLISKDKELKEVLKVR